MLRKKLLSVAYLLPLLVLAAVSFDYLSNYYLFHSPANFTPLNTALVTLLVGAPATFYLVSQLLDAAAVRARLASALAAQEEAVHLAEHARIRTEEVLAKLRTSESTHHFLTEHGRDLIIQYDVDQIIRYASPSVSLFGYRPEDLIGRPMADFSHPDEAEVAQAHRRRMLRGEQPDGKPVETFRARARSGEWFWMQGVPSTLYDEAGQPCGVLSVMRDVTDAIRMTEELERRRNEAEAAARSKSDFMANMTHELRTPLNAIIGFSTLLGDDQGLAGETRRRLGIIQESSRTLLAIIDDVLDFSRLDAGAMTFENMAFDPVEIARVSLEMVGEQARAKGIALHLNLEGAPGWLNGDPDRIQQVVLNFLSNAVKFTGSGEIALNLVCTAETETALLRVEVRDTGVGVPDDQIGQIFSRFSQADASVSRRFGGSGLGLAICKAIVEAMGGRIGAHSRVAEGSTFWFELSLPFAEAPHADDDQTLFVPAGLRVLVVDDNAVNRELVRALLSPFELRLEEANDGVDAIAMAQKGSYDLILMDLQMPIMDGLTATRRIRAASAHHTPIIAMSANVLPEQVQQCLDAGMDGHIGKPIRPAELLAALASVAAPAAA